jgi:hypothetical protein
LKELQADLVRQQRVLANVALIEARDRAEDQERMRIRQEDAQKALQRASSDVSSSGTYSREQEGSGMQNDFSNGTNTTTSDIRGEQELGLEGEVKEVSSPGLNGLKIRPPTFLTPAKSQPTINTGSLEQSSVEREHQCQWKKTEMGPLDTAQSASSDSAGTQTQKSTDAANPLPIMPSRVTETESWAPKARARG